MVFLYILIILYSGSITCGARSLEYGTDGEDSLWGNLRLPKSVIPLVYDIFLHPNLTAAEYSGRVQIKCQVRNATNFIVLHSKDLIISRVKLTTLPSNELHKLRRQTAVVHYDQLYFEVENDIPSDTEILITIDFHGRLLNGDGNGFYITEYFNNKHETGMMASTQFEPISARRAFPCFDEPDMKANFSMSIVRDKDYLSLFNMPLVHSMPFGENLMLDTFQPSVKMSTYLVAFAICDFASLSNQTKTGINVTLYASRDKIEEADYALRVASKVLDYFSGLFDVPYPLPKLDIITVPSLGFGGMENWGLITGSPSLVLYDPAKAWYQTKFRITRLVAHELAHQWFGNIVTMKWWSDIWLNEGFATFMTFKGLQAVNDIWTLENEFTTRIRSMGCEDFNTPPSLVQPVSIPDRSLFGCTTYSKGASLLRMLESLLGETDFDIGIKSYLKKNKFDSVMTDDLWQALSNSSKDRIDVKSVMETWVSEPGYPVVTVTRQDAKVHISQKRLSLFNNQGFQSGMKWNIPFVYGVLGCDGHMTYNTTWLKDRPETITIRSDDKLLKGNYGESGYYRVNYDTETWKAITEQLISNHQIFSQGDRAHLLNDAFAFAGSGLVNMTLPLELTKYLENEDDYLPWYSVALSGKFLHNKRNTTEFYLLKIQLCNITTKKHGEMTSCDKNEDFSTARLCELLDNITQRFCPTKASKKSKRYLHQRARNEEKIEQEVHTNLIDDGLGYVNEREWPF